MLRSFITILALILGTLEPKLLYANENQNSKLMFLSNLSFKEFANVHAKNTKQKNFFENLFKKFPDQKDQKLPKVDFVNSNSVLVTLGSDFFNIEILDSNRVKFLHKGKDLIVDFRLPLETLELKFTEKFVVEHSFINMFINNSYASGSIGVIFGVATVAWVLLTQVAESDFSDLVNGYLKICKSYNGQLNEEGFEKFITLHNELSQKTIKTCTLGAENGLESLGFDVLGYSKEACTVDLTAAKLCFKTKINEFKKLAVNNNSRNAKDVSEYKYDKADKKVKAVDK